MQHQVYTHHLHGLAALASQTTAPSRGASLLSCDGDRLIAVAVGSSLDVYDASNAVELTEYIGSGACRLRSLCSHVVRDAGADVDIRGLCFLHGGSLCVYGSSSASEASVIHVYRLCVSASVDSDAAAYLAPLVTPEARSRAPTVVLTALPQLIYRAALPGVSTLRVVPYPSRLHTFGVTLDAGCDVHFYDAAPTATGSAGTAHITTVTHRSGVDSITFAPDGRTMAITSVDREIAIFAVTDAASTPAFTATHICSFLAETAVTAVSILRIPSHPDAALFARFAHNDTAIVTGHDNGFINVWWCGALPSNAYPIVTEPVASYPPFHASRGAVTAITAGVVVDECRDAPPSLFQVGPPAKHLTSATVVAVGATGARGWRVYTLDHVEHSAAHAGAVAGLPPQRHRRETPTNVIKGHYVWDARGRRSYVPPAPRVVEHLLVPGLRMPSYAECMRAPIIGDAASIASGSVTLPMPSATGVVAVPRVAAGIIPLGCAVLSRSSAAPAGRLELPRGEYVDDVSVFRLLSRSGVASFEHPADAGSAAPARYLQSPRTVMLLLSEKGIHCAGLDYHTALVRTAPSTAVTSAAVAVARTMLHAAPDHAPPAVPRPSQEAGGESDQENAAAAEVKRAAAKSQREAAARDDINATVRARYYWPSAAVTSHVTGVRRTVFSGDVALPSRATALYAHVVRHDGDDHHAGSKGVQHAGSKGVARSKSRPRKARPDAPAPVTPTPRVYSLSELEYMPHNIRARLLRRAAPPPPPQAAQAPSAQVPAQDASVPQPASDCDEKRTDETAVVVVAEAVPGVTDSRAGLPTSPIAKPVRESTGVDTPESSHSSPASGDSGASSASGFVWETDEASEAGAADDLWAAEEGGREGAHAVGRREVGHSRGVRGKCAQP